MNPRSTESPVFDRIQQLVEEEHRLYEEGSMDAADLRKLADVEVELDQCWDLLRQRRARREIGEDPSQARVRPAEVVENYEQ